MQGSRDKMLLDAIHGFDMNKFLQQAGLLKAPKTELKVGQAQFRRLDARTTAQLEADRFSGIRANELANRFEIWILGRIAVRGNTAEPSVLSYAEFFLRPAKLNELYCETFGIDQMNFDAKTNADIARLEERKALLSEPEVQRAVNALEDSKTQE